MDSINKSSLLEKRLIVAFHLSHSINLISATSKSFSPVHTIKSVGLQDLYLHSFDMFLKTVSLNMDSESRILLQIAIRMLLHRLIVCLDEEEMVPLLPNAIQTLFLSSNEITAKSLQELVPLFSQIVPKYKHSWLFQRDILPFIGQIFSPLVLLFFNLYTSAGSESEKFNLQKSYYVFMNIIFTSNLIPSFFDLGKCSCLFVLFEFPVTICTCFLQKRNWLKKYSVHWLKARSITPTVKFSEYATRLWPNWSKSMVWLPHLTSVNLMLIFAYFLFFLLKATIWIRRRSKIAWATHFLYNSFTSLWFWHALWARQRTLTTRPPVKLLLAFGSSTLSLATNCVSFCEYNFYPNTFLHCQTPMNSSLSFYSPIWKLQRKHSNKQFGNSVPLRCQTVSSAYYKL